jgi:hypothetical protein
MQEGPLDSDLHTRCGHVSCADWAYTIVLRAAFRAACDADSHAGHTTLISRKHRPLAVMLDQAPALCDMASISTGASGGNAATSGSCTHMCDKGRLATAA